MENPCLESGRAGSCTWVLHMLAPSLHHPAIKVTHLSYQYTQQTEHFCFHFSVEQKQILKPQSSHVAELLSLGQLIFADIFPDLGYLGYCLP